MASAPRKRAWGRSKHRNEITVVDEMEIELAEKESRECKKIRSDAKHGLHHPELMTNDELIAVLQKMRVPVPVYPDGNPNRERLVFLFRRHVTPRPQRTRQTRRSRCRVETGATPTETEPGMDWSKTVEDLVQESPESDRKRSVRCAYSSDCREVVLYCHSNCVS